MLFSAPDARNDVTIGTGRSSDALQFRGAPVPREAELSRQPAQVARQRWDFFKFAQRLRCATPRASRSETPGGPSGGVELPVGSVVILQFRQQGSVVRTVSEMVHAGCDTDQCTRRIRISDSPPPLNFVIFRENNALNASLSNSDRFASGNCHKYLKRNWNCLFCRNNFVSTWKRLQSPPTLRCCVFRFYQFVIMTSVPANTRSHDRFCFSARDQEATASRWPARSSAPVLKIRAWRPPPTWTAWSWGRQWPRPKKCKVCY